MRTLVIDCATEACSVALFDGEAIVSGDYAILGRGHAEALLPMIAALPNAGKAQRIAVDRGPGSFTGIRIGLAAARALGLAWKARVVTYSATALQAAMARAELGAVPVTVVNNAGHGEWFVQDFAGDGTSLSDLLSLGPEIVAQRARSPNLAGSRASEVAGANDRILAILPDARCFASLPFSALGEDLSPLYGRAPDARLSA